MNSDNVYALFDTVAADKRLLCINAAAVGCWLFQQGHQAAGMKLLHTAVVAAGLDTGLVQWMLDHPQKSFDALAMHAEIRALIK